LITVLINSVIMIKEACIETLQEALHAYENGADQLEVCSHLEWDGLTPTWEFVVTLKNKIPLPLNLMIRQRSGDFEYSDDEISEMIKSIKSFKELRPKGFVLGCTHRINEQCISLDIEKIKILADAAYPFPVTVHKAIDICTDILAEVEKIKSIDNVKYILTSGGAETAQKGISQLEKMRNKAKPEIKIIAAGKVTKNNISDLHKKLGLEYYHGRNIV
jgi:copper homeostasis protein